MELIILGSGTNIPSSQRVGSGYLLKDHKDLLLLDFGPGVFWHLAKAKINYHQLQYILLTHLHSDHCADLVSFLFNAGFYSSRHKRKNIILIGPKGTKNFLIHLKRAFLPNFEKRNFKITVKEAANAKFSINNFKIETKILKHMPGRNSVGYRIKIKDKIICYSGDVSYTEKEKLINLCQNADLAILECAFPKRHPKPIGHLRSQDAAKIAKETNVKKLILTHFYPAAEKVDVIKEVRQEFKGKIIKAKDLMTIKF